MNGKGGLPTRWWPWLFAAGIFVAFFLHLQGIPLFDLDEGAFSEATREMLVNHDFLTTYLNGVPRYAKPILIYWFQAASVSIFGVHTFAFRLPSALAAVAWMLAIFAFVRPRFGREAAYAAGLLATCSMGVAIIGRAAIADSLLNLFLALSAFDVYRYYETGRAAPRNRVFLWMALGFLTKGPIAMLAVPVSLLFFGLRGEWRAWARAAFSPVGWAIFLAIAAPWYIAEYLHQGQAFIDSFFLKNNFGRYGGHAMQGHGGDIFYYVFAVLLMLLPFSGWLLRLLGRLRAVRGEPLDQFIWLWFGFTFVFFSFSHTKLPHYILYGCTPLFVLFARCREHIRSRWVAFLPVLLFGALVLALPEISRLVAARTSDAYVAAMLARGPAVFGLGYYVVALIGFAGALWLTFWPPRWPVWQRSLLAALLALFVLMQALLPAVGQLKQEPVMEAGLLAKKLGGTVVMWRINMPSFSVYRQAITPSGRPKPGEMVFTNVNHLPELAHMGRYQLVYSSGGIVLARFLGPQTK
ncbi:ArnT family glycosyltransferase [Acidihalobacter ferrooxydans]|uniref:Glycosyltransferase RgtA/B/C/D-like domain-containing protein n=1 Tax=Acidihalobacter ferrooxydans TaxID=1765967 RepID=A0A1P8UD65_9GAMM|nr:glycosyltransferase family 39 protein [Acidihalobacter ferrooxydans]APZ41811.1 hypothetical protein BW247_00800 [Acidihalobacter ferrooxydans]